MLPSHQHASARRTNRGTGIELSEPHSLGGELIETSDRSEPYDNPYSPLLGTPVAKFKHMMQRIEPKKVQAMIEESKQPSDDQPAEDAESARRGEANRVREPVVADRLRLLGYLPQGDTRIGYVEELGDFKTAWDLITFAGFLGTGMRLEFTWHGCDSALAAPLVLDLARLTAETVAGQVGTENADLATQTRDALASVDALLERAGTDKSKALQVIVWLADMADFAEMNAIYDAWIDPANPPVRACGEAKLATPGYRVEFIVTAAL